MAASLLGDLYKSQGKYDMARDQYQRVAKLDKYNYVSHYNLGVTYQLLDQLKEAVTSYKRSLALNPDYADSNMNLGLAYVAMRENDEAIKSLRKATDLNPQSRRRVGQPWRRARWQGTVRRGGKGISHVAGLKE